MARDRRNENDEDERPRKKRGLSKGLLFGLIGGGVVGVTLVVGLVVILTGQAASPTATLKRYQAAVAAGKWEESWDLLCESNKRHWDSPPQFIVDEVGPIRGKELYIFKMTKGLEALKRLGRSEHVLSSTDVVTETVTGDKATVIVKWSDPDGSSYTGTYQLLQEQGKWKVQDRLMTQGKW